VVRFQQVISRVAILRLVTFTCHKWAHTATNPAWAGKPFPLAMLEIIAYSFSPVDRNIGSFLLIPTAQHGSKTVAKP
jgi:hypothetical protein